MNSKTTPGKPYPPTERLVNAAAPSKSDLNLEIRRNIYESSGKDVTPVEPQDKDANGESSGANGNSIEESLKEPEKEFFCHSCGKNCTRVRWHNAKSTPGSTQGKMAAMTRYDICAECFLEGRFAASTTASDYIKIEHEGYTSIKDRDKPWNDGETLLLLEGLELFDEDWSSIANHVGTRTREQCVLKFLQLEIEDKYIDAEMGTDNGANLAYLGGGRVPFSQAENPVMSVVGFLAGAVDPSVAAAAAGRTVEEMRRTLRERLENGEDGSPASKPPAADKDTSQAEQTHSKADDNMDIDASTTTAKATPSSSESEPATIAKHSDPATTALALTAARASALASHEERYMTALLSTATNLQLQKLELKLQQFSEMEKLLQKERRDLERRRRDLFLERLSWRRRVEAVRDAVGKGLRMTTGGGAGGAAGMSVEAMKAVMDALAGLGMGEELELREAETGGGGAELENGSVAGGGMDMKVDIEPYGPEDQGFRSYEI